ncbi:MAG: hypothetical protein WC614_13055 [bacterium]
MKEQTLSIGDKVGLYSLFGFGVFVIALSTSEIVTSEHWRRTLEILGIALVTAAVIEFISAILIRKEFRRTLKEDLERALGETIRSITSVGTTCNTLGIIEVFECQAKYLEAHSIAKELKSPEKGMTVLCVGRSLVRLLDAHAAIQDALEAGVNFEFAILGPTTAKDERMRDLTSLDLTDIPRSLRRLETIEEWYLAHNGRSKLGSITLKFHNIYLPDTLLAYVSPKGLKFPTSRMFWMHYYGPDDERKHLLCLRSHSKWGEHLYGRFHKIWKEATDAYVLSPAKIKESEFKSVRLLLQKFHPSNESAKSA